MGSSICKQCGKEIWTLRASKKYCGDRCRQAAKRKRDRISRQQAADFIHAAEAAAAASNERLKKQKASR